MNHLSGEQSPYLLQHVDNPVDWYPWGDTAFARARAEQKLIFLSIGYSTCHWCHVMAHESFEDAEVAELLNRDYVSIKVDREERPDIDQVYMEVCQRLTGGGGWPLTIIMTPDALPFYAATYIPKHARHGRPGMMNLLPWVAAKWRDDPDFLVDAAHEAVATLQREGASGEVPPLDLNTEVVAEQQLKKVFDHRYGGFSGAPKFPRPHDLVFLLKRYCVTGNETCLEMVEQTLLAMRCGGIYDQLGCGFHRYSTDEKWLLPHFEKMLYDQAGLVQAYLSAWQMTGRTLYARTAREVLTYLSRDMCSIDGVFFSAEDADSEGVEGKFYLWTKQEITDVLGDEGEGFCASYQVDEAGNYHDEMSGQRTGQNILHLDMAGLEDAQDNHRSSREILFHVRSQRVRPHLDDKVITAWNGMVISAFAEAGRLLGEEEHVAAATVAADFIMENMSKSGRLYRRSRQGKAAINGFAEDYAYLARGILDLYNAGFESRRLVQAIELCETLRRFFQCPQTGRLYDTPSDGEELLVRPSATFDGATPSAGAITLEVFARLFLLTGDPEWQQAAERLLQSVAAEVGRYPAGYTQWLQAASWLLRPTRVVVVAGDRGTSTTARMLEVVRKANLQQTAVLLRSPGEDDPVARIAPFTRDMNPAQECARAYVCQDFACAQPMQSAQELAALINRMP